jgi:hypothetical protein
MAHGSPKTTNTSRKKEINMALKFDAKKAEGGFTLLPEGEYEVFPVAADHGTSSNGNDMLTVNYKIRDDVDQEGQGKELRFDRFVDTEGALWRFHAACKAAQFDEGVEFDDLQDFWKAFKGRAIRVIVKHEEATFGKNKGKTFPVVAGFKPSQVGGSMAVTSDGQSGGSTFEVTDDMLPF